MYVFLFIQFQYVFFTTALVTFSYETHHFDVPTNNLINNNNLSRFMLKKNCFVL